VNNLQLWEQVQATDPRYTKEYKGAGGFQGTAINATWLVKRATEQWGSIGAGWGYEIVEDRFDQGGPIMKGETVLAVAQIHTIRLRLWYMQDGERRTVEHYGHTPYVYANKYGVQTDLEAPKKSLTDALKKCLSLLGFGADIHMGLYEDVDYLTEARNESALTNADDKAEEARRQREEYEAFVAKNVEYMETSTTISELEKIFVAAVRRAQHKKDSKAIARFTRVKDARKAELTTEQEKAA